MKHQNFVCFEQPIIELLHALTQALRALVEGVQSAQDGRRVVAAYRKTHVTCRQRKVGWLLQASMLVLQGLAALIGACRRYVWRF